MKHMLTAFVSACLLGAGAALACEYRTGETKFADYARCVYGTDAVLEIYLPDNAGWDRCVYRMQAFMPAKLLAVTREGDGKEEASINCRGCIGNPCYLMKSACDAMLKAQQR